MYVDLLPPCNAACPAGENIQGWLAQMKAGEHERAWRVLVADNPFRRSTDGSATTRARASCNRAQLDSAVSIHSVERFLGDQALERGWQFDPPTARSGKRVLVVGCWTERAVGRVPPGAAWTRGRDPRRRCRSRAA